jgi:hypothetical protein
MPRPATRTSRVSATIHVGSMSRSMERGTLWCVGGLLGQR